MWRLLVFYLVLAGCVSAPAREDILHEMGALEAVRSAAIRADDETTLSTVYAPDFQGVAANGSVVNRAGLFAVFARTHAGAPELLAASRSEVLTARREGNVVVVTGRLHFGQSDSVYTHVFRWRNGRWELFAAAATPVAAG